MAVLLEQISSNIYMEAAYEAHVRTRFSQTPMMRLFDYLLSLNPEPIAHLVIKIENRYISLSWTSQHASIESFSFEPAKH